MNETTVNIRQAKGKGNILAQLFTNKSRVLQNDLNKKLLKPFEATLQDSLKNSGQEGIKASLQDVMEKKVELNGTKMASPMEAHGEDPASAIDLQGDFSRHVNEMGLVRIAAAKMPDSSDVAPAVRLEKADVEMVAPGRIGPGMPSVEITGPENTGKYLPVGLPCDRVVDHPQVVPARSASLEPIVAMPFLVPNQDGIVNVGVPEIEMVPENKAILYGVQQSAEDRKAWIEASVVDIVMIETNDPKAEVAQAVAAQIAAICADAGPFTPAQASCDQEEATCLGEMETERFFKAKVADVLIAGGMDRDTADRIADQIKKVILTKEVILPETVVAKIPLGIISPVEKEIPFLVHPEGKSLSARKSDEADPACPIDEDQVLIVEETPVTPAKGEKKEFKRESVAPVMVARDVSGPHQESLDSDAIRTGAVGEDILRHENAWGKQKPLRVDQTKAPTQAIQFSALNLTESVGEAPAAVQTVRAQDVISQISDWRNTQIDSSGRVKIVLDPPHLGAVEMEVVVRGDRVSAVMTTDNGSVRQILQSQAEEMKQALNDQGFRIDRIEVKQSEDKSPQQWQHHGREWSQQRNGGYQQRKEQQETEEFQMSEYMKEFSIVA